MKATEIRDLTDEELRQRLTDARQEILNLRIQKSTGQLQRPLRLRVLRRDIARMRTIMRERTTS